jgi:hypothetical protein
MAWPLDPGPGDTKIGVLHVKHRVAVLSTSTDVTSTTAPALAWVPAEQV